VAAEKIETNGTVETNTVEILGRAKNALVRMTFTLQPCSGGGELDGAVLHIR
jgi:hypothetical protein